jgi:hypothetical protein
LKIFFLILVLVLVAFIAIEVVGVGKNSVEKPAGYSDGDAAIKCPGKDYQVFCSMDSLLSPFSKKLELKKKTFTLTQGAPHIPISVDPDEKNSFREVGFKFQQGNDCAVVQFTGNAACPKASRPDCNSSSAMKPDKSSDECSLKYQEWPCKDAKEKLFAGKSGGKLDFQLKGMGPCTVAVR